MSTGDEESTLQELVIIRRRGGESEAPHKGGVWKIAYADFMTAMMAFFLVMWLINATDKKVLTQVATYFNPLRLTDKSPTPRGLHDADTGAPGSENAPGQSKVKDGTAKGAKLSPAQQKIVEEALFSDPYGTLEILAQQAAKARGGEPRPSATQDQSAAPSRKPGEAFRDPFDPEARHAPAREIVQAESPQIADVPAAGEAADPVAGRSAQPDTGKDAQQSQGKSERDAPVVKPGDAASSGPAQRTPAADSTQLAQADAAAKATMPADGAEKAGEGQPARELKEARDALSAREAREAIERAETARLHEEIKQALNQLDAGASPEIDVTVTEEGLLISLTDKFDFGMFAIASAEPRPALVLVMEQIAKVLQTRPGQIIVRGHTDGRPFRSANYDNWRLSTARAHMAYYMLVRGGLDEKRVERVEGHADRSLRVPADPEAAQNRRIELLLRRPKP